MHFRGLKLGYEMFKATLKPKPKAPVRFRPHSGSSFDDSGRQVSAQAFGVEGYEKTQQAKARIGEGLCTMEAMEML